MCYTRMCTPAKDKEVCVHASVTKEMQLETLKSKEANHKTHVRVKTKLTCHTPLIGLTPLFTKDSRSYVQQYDATSAQVAIAIGSMRRKLGDTFRQP